MEEYEQICKKGGEKRVLLMWGKGIDEERVVETVQGGKKGWGRCWI